MEKQDTSGNERERECESETVDHVMVVSTCLFLRATLKAGLILILARTGLKKLKQLQTCCYASIDPRTPVQKRQKQTSWQLCCSCALSYQLDAITGNTL